VETKKDKCCISCIQWRFWKPNLWIEVFIISYSSCFSVFIV